jgi:hypothetical protein
MEEFTLECPICLEESSVDNFYQITYGIEGREPIRSIIIEEGCKDCLLAEDVRARYGTKKSLFDYEIKNQTEYIKKKQKNWAKKVFDLNFDDVLSNAEALEIVNDSGVNSIQNACESDRYKALRENLKFKELLGLIPGPLKLPATLTGTNSHFFHLKSTIEKYVRLTKRGKYHTTKTHKVPFQRLIELAEKDYVAFNEDNKAYFLTNTEERNTVCRKCGEIKDFDQFRSHKYNYKRKRITANWGKDDSFSDNSACGVTGIQMAYMCCECESLKAADRYKNFSPEEYEKFYEGVKAWRKANKDKVRKYKKTPQSRAHRNIRSRLSKFLKKAKDHHFSKGVGCTRKELVKHLESQFTEGMSWETYGAGENGDHIGSWHIDHIKPISKFKGEYPNHYTNLQPMWGMENIKKSNNIYE